MNDIITRAPRTSMLLDTTRFESAHRAGKMMALSALFPSHLRSGGQETAIANAVLVMNIAEQMQEDPLAVAQNIYFVSGKPGWNASYMISRANQSGIFKGPIRWRMEGEGPSLVVHAYAKMAEDGEEVSAEASMAMAKAEGWAKNAKYASMPKQMLQYRAATFLIRLYCPQVMLGYQVAEEIEDIVAAEAKDITPPADPAPAPEEKKPSRAELQKKHRADEGAKKDAQKAAPKPKVDPDTAEDAEVIDKETGEVTDAKASDYDMSGEAHSLFSQISEALGEAKDSGEVEGLLEMFGDQLEWLAGTHPEAAEEIQIRADEARERVA